MVDPDIWKRGGGFWLAIVSNFLNVSCKVLKSRSLAFQNGFALFSLMKALQNDEKISLRSIFVLKIFKFTSYLFLSYGKMAR